jgi:hypothetical protein
MANRTTSKSNIITKNVPTVTNAILTDILNNELAENVVFGEDVAVVQNSGSSNISVDFTGKDRVDLTRTGGSLNITLSGIGDGEVKYLLIAKTSGQAVSFVGVTDVTPIKANANALSLVLYEIVRKSSYYFAKAWVENVKTATDTIEGVLETATQAESNALSAVDKTVTPGRQPIASTSQKGIIEIATQTEANALADVLRSMTPGTLPLSTTTQKGLIEIATAAQNNAGTAGNLAVIASELKRKLDDAADSSALSFSGTPAAGNYVTTLRGKKLGKVQSITGAIGNTVSGGELFVGTISGYQSPGYEVYFPLTVRTTASGKATGRIDGSGNIYVIYYAIQTNWVFTVSFIGI